MRAKYGEKNIVSPEKTQALLAEPAFDRRRFALIALVVMAVIGAAIAA